MGGILVRLDLSPFLARYPVGPAPIMTRRVVDSFRREYFLVMIDSAIASLTSRFEQMTAFDDVFGFLFNSENLKSLDEADLWLRCKIFVEKFSHDNSSDVEINDFFFRIKGVASDFARFFDVGARDSEVCYGCRLLSKYFSCLSNSFNCSFGRKKFLKIEVVEELFEINYVIRKVKWIHYVWGI